LALPKKKSIDQLVADYVRSRNAHGVFRVDGKGVLVRCKGYDPETELFSLTKTSEFGVVKAFDPKDKLHVGGIANANETDRINEVLNPTGVIANAFNKNSVLLRQHNHCDPVGLVTMLRPEDNGVHFEAWVGDPAAGPLTPCQTETRSLIAQRVLKAVSVGFIPLKIRMPAYNDEGAMVDPARIEEWEMLELSVVSVPCNAGALFEQRSAKAKTPTTSTPKKVWSFPVLGDDGKFKTKTPKEKQKMDEELKELLQKLGVSMDSVASTLNKLAEGQKGLQTTLDTLSAAKGKKPPPKESEDEDEDDDAKKAVATLAETVKALDGRIKELEETGAENHKTLTLLVEKLTGEKAA
jgi:phage head maturation protease